MDSSIHLDLAPITHNPWHPAYELTPEARLRVMKEIAPEIVKHLAKQHPSAPSVSVSFGGIPYAGSVRTNRA